LLGSGIAFATFTESLREERNNDPQQFPNDTHHYPQMKLTKTGRYKNKGVTTLVDAKLSLLSHKGYLTWHEEEWALILSQTGLPGLSTYDYALKFTADELAMLVETALRQASKDGAIHAHAKAMGAFIREVLDETNKPADT
jgi:hypothetical protein